MVDDSETSPASTVEGAEPEESEDLRSEWIGLFGLDDAPRQYPRMFDQAIAELDRVLEMRPHATEDTLLILDRQFARALEPATWGAVTNSLTNYCGIGPTLLLNWLVWQNTDTRLAVLETRADSARVVSYYRSILGRFWDELNSAQVSVSTSLDDWIKIDKHVYYDTLEETYRSYITLTKVSNERVALEMSPDSVLNLTRHLLVMIAAHGRLTDFSEDKVADFARDLVPVYQLFAPVFEALSGSSGDGPEEDGAVDAGAEDEDAVPNVASPEGS